MLPDFSSNIIGRRYQLVDLLGQGGMGTVFRAVDLLNSQVVALKRVVTLADNIEFTTSYNQGDFRLALAQEFKLLASLRHPYVIEVLDYGFDRDQQPYFTMEMLESARTILDAGRDQPLKSKVHFLIQMLQALTYLHRRGIMHRDLKPANVLVVKDNVKVLDFGLSVMRDRPSSSEDVGATTAGTLAYMAPEVLVGNPATERSDLYAVGMIAYELLAGKHPFEGAEVGALVNHILYTVPDVLSVDISERLAYVLARLLHKEPAERYKTAQEVIAAFDEAIDEPIPVDTVATRESFLQAARLVGRNAELDTLSNALASAIQGNGSTWLVSGESGVGKSRLLDELRTLAMVEGALVVRGQSIAEGRSPFQMWRPVLRWLALLTHLETLDAGLIRLLVPDMTALSDRGIKEAAELDPQEVQAKLVQLIQNTFHSINQPVVIMLEDLHWASSESISLLAQLSQQAKNLKLLMIASYRDDERPDLPSSLPGIPILRLGRLDENSIAELSQAMLGDGGRQPEVVKLLQRETEGNIFFLVEVVRALAEEAGNLDEIGLMTLPEHVFAGGVQRIIQRRLTRISPEFKQLLQIAAVIGRQQELALLRELDGTTDLNMWLLECANAAVLDVQDGEWRFAHDKLREGVLQGLTDEERRQLHRRVATAIESLHGESERAASLAYHWGMAADATKEDYYVTLAAEQALRTGAYHEAVTFFDRALTLIGIIQGDERAAQLRRIHLQHRQAEAYLGFGKYEQAQHLYRNSLTMSEQIGERIGVARSLSALGEVSYALNDPIKARQFHQEALALYRELDDQQGVARTLNNLGTIAYDQGDHDAAKQLYQQSLNISREFGKQWGMAGAVSTASIAAEDALNYRETREVLAVRLESSVQDGDQASIARTLFDLGSNAFNNRDYDSARNYFQRSLQLYEELADHTGAIQALSRLGMVEAAAQVYDEADKYLRRALKVAKEHKVTVSMFDMLLEIARLHILRGSKEQALELLAVILHHADVPESVEDQAERLVFDLEAELGTPTMEAVWERGKTRQFDDVVGQIALD